MPIKQLDFLIHPLYRPLPHSVFVEEAKGREELWKSRADQISKESDHYLALRLPHHNFRSPKLEEFVSYLQEKMGERLILVEDKSPQDSEEGLRETYRGVVTQMKKIGFDPRRIRINIYGEYGASCVTTAIPHFLPHVVDSKRSIKQAARILLNLSTEPGEIIETKNLKGSKYADIKAKIRNLMNSKLKT
jgi:hypothetical protein